MEKVVLVDRADVNRKLPITADYVGGFWGTASNQNINVYLEGEGFHDPIPIEAKKVACP